MTIEQALFRLHEGLPRHAPGSEATTVKVLRRFGILSRLARVIDLGCGSGASTRVLAKRMKRAVIAVDAHQPYLDELKTSFEEDGLIDRVEPVHADFSDLGTALGRFDLLWAEGVAYVLGFEQSLLKWHPILASHGRIAISELSYLVEQPSDEVKEFWSSLYPGVSTVVGNCAAAERTGYQVVDTITLSRKDRRAYYGPIKARIAELRAAGELDAEMTVVIAETEKEIEFAEKHVDECGYVFYLLEKQGGEAEEAEEVEEVEEEFVDEEEGDEADEVEEDDEADVESVRRLVRRQSGSIAPRAFDVNVAPTNALVYQRFEQQLIDLIGQVGLERAAIVFERIERQVQAMIASR